MNVELLIMNAVENALNRANPTMLNLVKYYLNNTANADFSLAYRNPKEFKRLLSRIFGEYSTRLLEMLIIRNVSETIGVGADSNSLEELIDKLHKIAGREE